MQTMSSVKPVDKYLFMRMLRFGKSKIGCFLLKQTLYLPVDSLMMSHSFPALIMVMVLRLDTAKALAL